MAAKNYHKDIPLAGKWITRDPATIGNNFQTLDNLRYVGGTHKCGVGGMTKINTAIMNATYFKTRNLFHFKKSQPAESHVLAQAYNTGLTASQVLENTTAIPSAGAFSATALWTDSAGAGRGKFSDAADGQIIYANGVDSCIWGGNEQAVGALVQTTTALSAANDVAISPKIYTDQINNTKSDSENIITCGGSYLTFLIGSTRPAKGAKIYVSSANTTANTLVVKESTAGAWNALTVTTDGTRVTGKTFAQTGTISWATTVATTKPKYLEGYYLYWYQFTIDAGSAGIYHITLDLPFQSIIDMWDGVYRDIARFYIYTTSQADKSTNVYRQEYDAASPSTYADISGLVFTTQYLEVGFDEKQTAIYFDIPPGYENSTAATVASVDYWTGAAYATVGAISDGTATSGISFAKSGVISWNNTSLASEQKKQYANIQPIYYYRLKFDKTLDTSVRIDYVGGISASKTISYFKFPVFAQGRVLLCADMSGQKNKAIASSKFMPQVYNGSDSVDIYFGEEGELTCGTELFSQFGASLFSLVFMFKNNETWMMAGQDIYQWEVNTFLLSSSIGCPAPLTLKTINLNAEPGQGINRSLAIWQGSSGIYMSDGRAPIPVHMDIKEYFDPKDSRCIKASEVGNSTAFIDPVNQEYHWLFASGTAGTQTELVYSITENGWYRIPRGTGKALVCGCVVTDTNANQYNYGMIDTGYMERLEYGTDFDGNDIVHDFRLGDAPLSDSLMNETVIDVVMLFMVAKTTTTNAVVGTHYGDAKTTGTTLKALSPASSGHRVAQSFTTHALGRHTLHSTGFSMTTDNETTGFEPLAVAYSYHIQGEV